MRRKLALAAVAALASLPLAACGDGGERTPGTGAGGPEPEAPAGREQGADAEDGTTTEDVGGQKGGPEVSTD